MKPVMPAKLVLDLIGERASSTLRFWVSVCTGATVVLFHVMPVRAGPSRCGERRMVITQQIPAKATGAACAESSTEILTEIAPHRVNVVAAILRSVELD